MREPWGRDSGAGSFEWDSNAGTKSWVARTKFIWTVSEPAASWSSDGLQAEHELDNGCRPVIESTARRGKAVTYKALGGLEVIEYVERTVRAPAAGEVRIGAAAAVNPADILFRDPGYPIQDLKYRAR